MPEQETLKRAKQAKKEGKSASTQAGEFVREEIHHIREGKFCQTSNCDWLVESASSRSQAEATAE